MYIYECFSQDVAPSIQLDYQKPGLPYHGEIAENTASPKVLLLVHVTDPDTGAGGVVNCTLTDQLSLATVDTYNPYASLNAGRSGRQGQGGVSGGGGRGGPANGGGSGPAKSLASHFRITPLTYKVGIYTLEAIAPIDREALADSIVALNFQCVDKGNPPLRNDAEIRIMV